MPTEMAMVLAGGQSEGYGILTRNRTKAALPFGGFYRLIDFALSNLSHSDITHVGIVIQYLPASLIEHVGVGEAWDFHGVGRWFKIMPPFVGQGATQWFNGTADALYQNLNFVEDFMPDDVLVLSGEHVYKMDYRPLLAFHRQRGADVTIVCKTLPKALCSRRFGYLRINEDDEVIDYQEKPDEPPTETISMGVYVFRRETLVEWLETNARQGTGHQLASDIVPYMVGITRMMAYHFDGRWDYLPDVEAYFHAHQRLLDPNTPIDLVEWEVITNLMDRSLAERVPAQVGVSAEVERSMLSPGVRVEGVVRGSVLSPGVIVEKGAVVENCVLMHDSVVRAGARLRRVICDKDADFGENSLVGITRTLHSPSRPGDESQLSPLTLLGKGVRIEKGVEIPAGREIAPKRRRDAAVTRVYTEGVL